MKTKFAKLSFWIFIFVAFSLCGRSGLKSPPPPHREEPPTPSMEVCDGLDNDLDGKVDEDFRDDVGRYISDENCGFCGYSCDGRVEHATATSCILISDIPTCVAVSCEFGYRVSVTGKCIEVEARMCLDCLTDDDCGGGAGSRCVEIGGEKKCTVTCSDSSQCPFPYSCFDSICMPPGGSCSCESGQNFTISCRILTPDGEDCIGKARCIDGLLTECAGEQEICDYRDNDCDGEIDEDFRDSLGSYSVDDRNCGMCGVDCTESVVPAGNLVCGGDPYSPVCHLLCPDTLDGIQPGDHLDANLILADGCECTLTDFIDRAGPEGTSGEELDVNCDGADGDVRKSFYVAPDGDDFGAGSYMYPLASISEAINRAVESLDTTNPRPDIYIAAGTYFESLVVPDGIKLHGGYRKDFLALDSDSFLTVVISPDWTETPGGAALVVEEAGYTETEITGIHFIGAEPPSPGLPSFGVYIRSPGENLSFSNVYIQSANTLPARSGVNGGAGASPIIQAQPGEPPREAVEDSFHDCIAMAPENIVEGGSGGVNVCNGIDVSGGKGGDAGCPEFDSFQPAGQSGNSGGPSAPGGAGGSGGWDCRGPVTDSPCGSWVCCGLADFYVPLEYQLAGDGENGSDGQAGQPGIGCNDPLGQLVGDMWVADEATDGGSGGSGGGGGGGGAGGGAQITYYPVDCPYADGLGGGGGGGGAGGCGGEGGTAGQSAAPTIGVLIDYQWSGPPPEVVNAPSFVNTVIATGDGGAGGGGGAGGDGGEGGLGAAGGDIPLEMRTTPTLAGPTKGGHGGKGGNGGPGGGGGGGCGGSSVGIWVSLNGAGVSTDFEDNLKTGCVFELGNGGKGGEGGGGPSPGGRGADGSVVDIVVR